MRSLVPVTVVVLDYDRDEGFLTDESMYDPVTHRPSFTMSEVSELFFGRSKTWMADHYVHGHIELDGVPLTIERGPSRIYYQWKLCDVEFAAYALAQQGYIPAAQLVRTLGIIKLVAQNHGYLETDIQTEIRTIEQDLEERLLTAMEVRSDVTDDLDGSPGAEPRTFAINGTEYHIDLTDENWAKFLDAVTPYVKAATLSPRRAARSMQDVRAWARENGFSVGERGPVPVEIMAAWHRSRI